MFINHNHLKVLLIILANRPFVMDSHNNLPEFFTIIYILHRLKRSCHLDVEKQNTVSNYSWLGFVHKRVRVKKHKREMNTKVNIEKNVKNIYLGGSYLTLWIIHIENENVWWKLTGLVFTFFTYSNQII